MKKPLLFTSRKEVDVSLQLLEGNVPNDVKGAFYVVYPVGTVNSGGLPFPEKYPDGHRNSEYGSAIMNGDGMGLRVQFQSGQMPTVRTRIMKPPCFFADEATKRGNSGHEFLGFGNYGISRLSFALGARNELNTAFVPVRFGQKPPYLLATYDVGRPFALDPDKMRIQTAIGWNKEWTSGTPPMVPWPFMLTQSTAHPSFDAETQELFTTNFIRPHKSLLLDARLLHFLKHESALLEGKLEELAQKVEDHDELTLHTRVTDFFENIHLKLDRPDPIPENLAAAAAHPNPDVWLMRWDGRGDLERWSLFKPDGTAVVIEECMHQTSLTRDYIVLSDCSFKFSLDLLISPFPNNPAIERMIRRYLARPMVPATNVYIIRRRDLQAGAGKVTAFPLDQPIPVETIHYSCNYANPDGKITFLGVHNAATCVAEWVRPYDVNKLTGKSMDPELISLFSIGSMDVSRFGKWVIDAENARLLTDESKQFAEVGDWKSDNPGPNGWAIALYTYRDMISPEKNAESIRHLWFISDGVDNRMLTEFIFDLYKDYKHRIVPVDEVLEVTRKGVPFSLCRIDTDTMQSGDFFLAPPFNYMRCVHFIPRTTPTPGLDPQLDGYLMVLVQAGTKQSDQTVDFRSEFWLFDAAGIAKGPVAKMHSPEIEFAFVLHTSYLPEVLQYDNDYRVSVVEDYNESIMGLPEKGIFGFLDKVALTLFFQNFVYPHYPDDAGSSSAASTPGLKGIFVSIKRFFQKIFTRKKHQA